MSLFSFSTWLASAETAAINVGKSVVGSLVQAGEDAFSSAVHAIVPSSTTDAAPPASTGEAVSSLVITGANHLLTGAVQVAENMAANVVTTVTGTSPSTASEVVSHTVAAVEGVAFGPTHTTVGDLVSNAVDAAETAAGHAITNAVDAAEAAVINVTSNVVATAAPAVVSGVMGVVGNLVGDLLVSKTVTDAMHKLLDATEKIVADGATDVVLYGIDKIESIGAVSTLIHDINGVATTVDHMTAAGSTLGSLFPSTGAIGSLITLTNHVASVVEEVTTPGSKLVTDMATNVTHNVVATIFDGVTSIVSSFVNDLLHPAPAAVA